GEIGGGEGGRGGGGTAGAGSGEGGPTRRTDFPSARGGRTDWKSVLRQGNRNITKNEGQALSPLAHPRKDRGGVWAAPTLVFFGFASNDGTIRAATRAPGVRGARPDGHPPTPGPGSTAPTAWTAARPDPRQSARPRSRPGTAAGHTAPPRRWAGRS